MSGADVNLEHSCREVIALMRDALTARDDVVEFHPGPRSYEFDFLLRDGREVRVSLRVLEKRL